jgi:hypothetical protein
MTASRARPGGVLVIQWWACRSHGLPGPDLGFLVPPEEAKGPGPPRPWPARGSGRRPGRLLRPAPVEGGLLGVELHPEQARPHRSPGPDPATATPPVPCRPATRSGRRQAPRGPSRPAHPARRSATTIGQGQLVLPSSAARAATRCCSSRAAGSERSAGSAAAASRRSPSTPTSRRRGDRATPRARSSIGAAAPVLQRLQEQPAVRRRRPAPPASQRGAGAAGGPPQEGLTRRLIPG